MVKKRRGTELALGIRSIMNIVYKYKEPEGSTELSEYRMCIYFKGQKSRA
jgi:hypothetical protein